ncbi:hybrid sensor histidine kinase/response regulator [Achromobacter deleyi]|uniref:hybrid sensor histidine kinase/response regulator n=1 Tax=Achromobacter deleyi TaxID=1353891 RepID=UPI00149168C1|nr:response regulator [Achromobacter deleyi]QVQ27369.1 response regulator [Achromobacter deleyi]UIP22964.1 response regulator [Achromobacter deleyi]
MIALILCGTAASFFFLHRTAEQAVSDQLLARLSSVEAEIEPIYRPDRSSMEVVTARRSIDIATCGMGDSRSVALMTYANPIEGEVYVIRCASDVNGLTFHAEQDKQFALATFHLARNIVAGFASLAVLLIVAFTILYLRARRLSWASERGLSAFGECAPVVMYMRNLRGWYTHVNAAFLQIAASGSGRTLSDPVSSAEVDSEWRALDEDVLAARQHSSSVVGMNFNDSPRMFRVFRFPVFGADEEIIGVGGIGIDITQEPIAYREPRSDPLERQPGLGADPLCTGQGKEEAAIAEKAEMLSMIAHEIQTPLAAVTGIAYLMEQTFSKDKSGHVASLIEASRYLSAVVRNALDFSRLEAGKMDIQFRRFSLRRLVQQVFELAWRDAVANEVSLFTSLSPDVPDMVTGDDARIMQILLNYIQNAIRHGGPGLVVLEVTAISVNGLLHDYTFAVRDWGPGVAPDESGGLFKPFPRIAGRSKGVGNGLGLSITRRIADLMGGATWMEGNPGQGAVFFAKLPLVVDVSHVCTHQTWQFSGRRVWVIDPSPASREAIVSGLTDRGALVDVAMGQSPLRPVLRSDDSGVAIPEYVIVDWRCFSPALVDRFDAAFGNGRVHFIVLGPPLSYWNAGDLTARHGVHVRFKPTLLSEPCAGAANGCASCAGSLADQAGHIDKNCLANHSVLLAEDDDIVRSVMREILIWAGALVHVASNGYEALDILRRSSIDIVLMDLQMPGLNGFETAERIRGMPDISDLPIIAITASLSEADRAMASSCGVTQSLTKPVNPSQLLALMARLLGLRQDGEFASAGRVPAPGGDEGGPALFRRVSERIAALDEIRIDSALARLGGRHEIFVNIVRRVVDRADSPQSLLNPLADLADCDSAKLVFHKLTSELGIIGAEDLQAQAAQLEAAARQSALDRDAVDRFVGRYKKMIVELRRAAYSV